VVRLRGEGAESSRERGASRYRGGVGDGVAPRVVVAGREEHAPGRPGDARVRLVSDGDGVGTGRARRGQRKYRGARLAVVGNGHADAGSGVKRGAERGSRVQEG